VWYNYRKKRGIVVDNWKDIIRNEKRQAYYQPLREFLQQEYATQTIYPPKEQVFAAMHHTPFLDVKVAILGQDPYINPNEAHGMAFSVLPDARIPPSLRNIYKELEYDVNFIMPRSGYLMPWAKQGILLLNTVLTVRAGQSKSHANRGWETFTDNIIKSLNRHPNKIVFLLWGNSAKAKASLIDTRHKILTAAHPSPLAGGKFFGCRHFSQANDFLQENGQSPIDWQI